MDQADLSYTVRAERFKSRRCLVHKHSAPALDVPTKVMTKDLKVFSAIRMEWGNAWLL
jgi:hypothetical protein